MSVHQTSRITEQRFKKSSHRNNIVVVSVHACKPGELRHTIVKDNSPKNYDVRYCAKCGYVPINGLETVRSNEGIQKTKNNGIFKSKNAILIDFKNKQISTASESNGSQVCSTMQVYDGRMMKEAWALTNNAGWVDGEKETIKKIPDSVLKMVLKRIKDNPGMKCNAFSQCGWKFIDELKIRGISL